LNAALGQSALIETYIVLLYQVSRIRKSQKNCAFQEVKFNSFLSNAAAKVLNNLTPTTFFADFY
jgi:hypothetical protein